MPWPGGARRRGNTQTPQCMFARFIKQTSSLNLSSGETKPKYVDKGAAHAVGRFQAARKGTDPAAARLLYAFL